MGAGDRIGFKIAVINIQGSIIDNAAGTVNPDMLQRKGDTRIDRKKPVGIPIGNPGEGGIRTHNCQVLCDGEACIRNLVIVSTQVDCIGTRTGIGFLDGSPHSAQPATGGADTVPRNSVRSIGCGIDGESCHGVYRQGMETQHARQDCYDQDHGKTVNFHQCLLLVSLKVYDDGVIRIPNRCQKNVKRMFYSL